MSLHKRPLGKTPCLVFCCGNEQQNNFLLATLTDRSLCKLSLYPGAEMNKNRTCLELISSTWTVALMSLVLMTLH